MSNSLCFNNVKFEIVDHAGQPWVTARQLAQALGYAREDSVLKIYERNKEEFSSMMSATVKMTVGLSEVIVRIFSMRGCHLVAMLSRSPVAKQFRRWVLDVLDNMQQGRALPATLTASTPDSRRPLEKLVKVWASQAHMPHAQAWTQVNAHFTLNGIADLPTEWIPDAIAFVEGKIDTLPKALIPAQAAPHVDRLRLTPWDKVQMGKEAVEILERAGKAGPRTMECILLKLRYLDAIQDVLKLGSDLAADINKTRVGVFGKIVQQGNTTGCMTDPIMDALYTDTYTLQRLAREFEDTAFSALRASICGAKMLGV